MLQRRRFLSIAAACGAAIALPRVGAAGEGQTSVWRGVAMGAVASMTLVHPDRTRAHTAIRSCVAEVERLESLFSLYRPASALSKLNAGGELADAPQELVELLSLALALARDSGGAFDPTVQPLYRLYAEHCTRDPAGRPDAAAIERVRRLVDHRAVQIDGAAVRLRHPGMAITLNGIAQGYLADRIADLLRANGFDDVLVDLGEARALGQRPGGGPWIAALADPLRPGRTLLELPLGEGASHFPALSTSAGSGTPFGADPRMHHLLDPHTGRSANHHVSVSVAAPRATVADGLSTALAIIAPARADAVLRAYAPARAWFVDARGRVRRSG
jgi:thiamine biosynthesis lipoprotein